MQKLDYIQALEVIKEELLVDKLYAIFSEKTSSGTRTYSSYMQDLLTVNTNFSNLQKRQDNIGEVISHLDRLKLAFFPVNFAQFITAVAKVTDVNAMQNNYAKQFLSAYKFIKDLYEVNKAILSLLSTKNSGRLKIK